jgi:cytochrome b561/polyisoprenoid-binding protein YceI
MTATPMAGLAPADPSRQRYTSVAIALHWLIAIGIVGMIFFGWYMGDLPDGADKYAAIQLHKSFGITILMLTVVRIAWRLMNPPPPEPPMPGWQARIASATHIVFYALMILLPLSGWIMSSASPTGIATRLFSTVDWPHIPVLGTLPLETRKELHEPLEFIHSKLAWVLLVLLGLHVAAAIKHQFMDRDGVIARMAPGLFGRTEGPPAPARGGVIAFGSGLLLFAAIAGYGLVDQPAATAAADQTPVAPAQSNAPAWTVDPAQSSIVFKASYMGRPFEGRFTQWTADIRFDPEAPETARIRVVIPTASIQTGESYYDENVVQGDWLNTPAHPDAIFEVNEGVSAISEGMYEATGVLTLKGERFPVRLPFTLGFDGPTARMDGETSLQRSAIGVGRGTLNKPQGDAEWVGEDVVVVIKVVATRQ